MCLYLKERIGILRRFRDDTPAKNIFGRAFIRTYYAISPTIVRWFSGTGWFKAMWRGPLDRMVRRLTQEGVKDTPYQERPWYSILLSLASRNQTIVEILKNRQCL